MAKQSDSLQVFPSIVNFRRSLVPTVEDEENNDIFEGLKRSRSEPFGDINYLSTPEPTPRPKSLSFNDIPSSPIALNINDMNLQSALNLKSSKIFLKSRKNSASEVVPLIIPPNVTKFGFLKPFFKKGMNSLMSGFFGGAPNRRITSGNIVNQADSGVTLVNSALCSPVEPKNKSYRSIKQISKDGNIEKWQIEEINTFQVYTAKVYSNKDTFNHELYILKNLSSPVLSFQLSKDLNFL